MVLKCVLIFSLQLKLLYLLKFNISFNFDNHHYTLCFVLSFFGRKYHIEFGVLDKEKGVAYGIYVDNINSTGYE